MPSFPAGVQTVTVTYDCRHPDGSHFRGRIVFAPEPASVTSAAHDVIVLGDVSVKPDPTTGLVVVTLLATDAEGFTPTGWTYRVYEKWQDAHRRDYPISLPAAIPAVNLADIAPTDPAEGEYVIVRGPQGIQGIQGLKGDPGTPGSGGGAVDSVNAQTGVVVLDAADVGADPAGSATTARTAAITAAATDATTKANAAQAAAISAAATDATTKAGTAQANAITASATDASSKAAAAQVAAIASASTDATSKANAAQTAATSAASTDATAKVGAHAAASDPHGDRAAASTALTAHVGAADPHGDRAAAASALATHAADSTAIHGITDTAALVVTTDTRLSNARTPTAHATTHAAAGSDPVTPAAIGAYASTDGNTLNGYVTDLQNRVGGAFGLENRATALEAGRLQVASNLSDLASAATARTSLGLGTAATQASSAFDTAGSAASALVSANAYTDAHAGGGGGVRTASARITNDNLSGLPAAAAWAVILTSTGTPLQCSIAAAAGDRIRVYGRYMRAGSHFLDWVLLSSAGAIAIYSGTDTSSPLAEGDPALYPSLSFAYEPGPPMFTVGAGHIDGTGKATIGLAHQGTGSGLVYAHTTYPWRLRLENVGPEPA
jgi:hypothetical protein